MATLVGRDAELGRLLAFLDDALLVVPGAGRAVGALVSGDAGIGKSRLVSEVSAIAVAKGVTVLCGHCAEIGDSVPYLPFADALRGVRLPAGKATRLAEAVRKRPVLARLLPDGSGSQQGEADRSGLAREQMFGAVLGLLAELAADAPVLLILEDLHWADASTRDLLTFLSRMLDRERVAMVLTYRTDDLHRRHPLRPVVADLLRLSTVTSVELPSLPPTAMAELLSSIQNGPAPGPRSAAILNRIVERADGNPYYAEELLAASSDARPLPSGLAELLLSRVERVTDAAQQVLRAAAVEGRRADDDIVRALVRDSSGLADPEYDAAVRELVAHQLLVPDLADAGHEPGSGYAFRHALLREAVYNDLMPGERTRLHARLAALLATRAPGTPGVAAQLAHHSLASHDIPGAFAASIQAGREAHHLAAPAEAHRHYDQALALWDRVADAEKLAGMTWGTLSLRSATAAAHAGDVPRAVQLLRRLRDALAVDAQDAELRSRTGERLAYFLLQMDSAQEHAEALRVAQGTVSETPAQPPTAYRARAMATYALALMVSEGYDTALDWAQRAQAAARQADAPWVEADALVTIGLLASRAGEQEEAIRTFTAAHEQAAGTEMLSVELRATYHLSRERLSRGELAEAARIAHIGVLRADDEGLGLAPYGLDLQHLHFQAHYADGHWDHVQELADSFTVHVTSQPEAVLSAMALFIDVARGNPAADERRTWLEPFWGDEFVAFIARGLYAEHALWRGDTDLVLAEAHASINCDGWPTHTPAVIRPAAIALSVRADRAMLARARGDDAALEEELRLAAELLEIAREGARYPSRPSVALGPEGRGWLARCEAEFQRARARNFPGNWELVLAEFGPGYVYETARTQWRLAQALAEAGRRDDAAHIWGSAVATANKLGAAPLRAALDGFRRRARLDPRAAGEGTGHPAANEANEHGAGSRDGTASPLTEREREVLRLVALGKSNREIAAELFIAPKTASVHVSNILGKLGAASRTEAAAIAHREGLQR
ncbi:MAG: ATPase-like protein [Actinomycetia bacterium]|nr:ATPase-like protein [Actinomycetes bacterium]